MFNLKNSALVLLVTTVIFVGVTSAANASIVSWYFYGDNLDNALDSSVTLSPGFNGRTNVGISETYFDANGSGATITADGFRNNFTTPADILENFRNRNDIGHGIKGGTSTGELDSLDGTEMLRYTLDTSLTDYTAYISSVDGQEGVEFATSNLANPGALTWFQTGVHSSGDGNGSAAEVVNPILLDSVFGAGQLGNFLFVREEANVGGNNDDILVMQMSAFSDDGGGGGVVPEPTAFIVWSLLGMASVCYWRRNR